MKSILLIPISFLIAGNSNTYNSSVKNPFKKEQYSVTINSIGNNIADTNKTYILKFGKNISKDYDDLEIQQYIKYIERVLKT